eukprot:6713433-Prorocentrum_lima.AAC.1
MPEQFSKNPPGQRLGYQLHLAWHSVAAFAVRVQLDCPPRPLQKYGGMGPACALDSGVASPGPAHQ